MIGDNTTYLPYLFVNTDSSTARAVNIIYACDTRRCNGDSSEISHAGIACMINLPNPYICVARQNFLYNVGDVVLSVGL